MIYKRCYLVGNPPKRVTLAMKSTEKQTLSFQETTRPQPNSNH